jgi:hypothetical protein
MGYCSNRRTPHPSLRAVRQYRPRRQHRAAARVAGLDAGICRGKRKSQSRRTSRDHLAAMPLLRRAHDRHRVFRARNAAAIPAAFPAYHSDRYVMSWNVLLEHTMPRRLTGRSQAVKPTLCLRWQPAAKTTAQNEAGRGDVSSKAAPIPSIRLAAIQKTRAPLTDADAVSLKSP